MPDEPEMLTRLAAWGEQHDSVRAMILTSTRAIPNAPLDEFSDYDVILILTDIRPFWESRAWMEAAFGRILAMYRDPILLDGEFEKSANVTQFEGDLRIDFSLWPIGLMRRIVIEPLPDEFDAGYRVLLDKDHLTDALKPPTYKAYIPTPPTEQAYLENIENCFLCATVVAKLLRRDDVVAAKFLLDGEIKHENLRPMLEWRAEIEHHWSVKPGPYGRGLKKWLRPDLWAELADTYTGAGVDENWEALYKSLALLRRVALEVSEKLGYAYPHDLEARVMAHLERDFLTHEHCFSPRPAPEGSPVGKGEGLGVRAENDARA
jgi:aminoglycoside 6-adenylyltransferase